MYVPGLSCSSRNDGLRFSQVDATDAKGEPIHQTLMAKKMAKMDESLDFRPFKFRIAAFTNGFLEEVREYNSLSISVSRFVSLLNTI